ncbi:metallophosphoesterase family protein [Flavimaricola marinus]|uniref:Serine/threonine-protein phosphatase 2 n=1 Tax=Flavimaricola marinus TaxID=1819565 RepID=A0A238L993_9RHOB|nr:metallophosphoesterase family protein [Flavimaricola marinus]SMY06277.1 Serine/threonine-protein phosphatase 2 [Flavimaricola marinus]
MLGRLFRSLRAQPSKGVFGPVAPAEPFYAVGDVHGRSDLLTKLLSQFDPDTRVVMVGDYIDRGDESRAVLDLLTNRPGTVCLRGNHEQMLIDFLSKPAAAGARFLRNGGLQTLASYGIGGVLPTSADDLLAEKAAQLHEAMGAETVDWLRELPYQFQSGNVVVVHAGADPNVPMDLQAPRHLMWGHKDFPAKDRQDGLWIVHGHTIVPQVDIEPGRIAIDTGAYATGRLSAVLVNESGAHVIQA